ncbi:MAG: hypothetical protein Q8P93_00145 [bacterium]|nr:hypothetical protein [bacterium]
MDKLNKLSLPITIIIASLILGGFYYASQVSKQNSIERQQAKELQVKRDLEQAKKEQDDLVKTAKRLCAIEAESSASEQYRKTCTYDCQEGYYYTKNYDNYYNTCLQRNGVQ